MDSGFYRRAFVSGTLPPHIPLPGSAQDQPLNDTAELPNTDWTVHSPNIARGNLDSEQDPKDPRTYVGWREGASPEKRLKDPAPWMSSTEQQPFMWSVGSVENDDEP